MAGWTESRLGRLYSLSWSYPQNPHSILLWGNCKRRLSSGTQSCWGWAPLDLSLHALSLLSIHSLQSGSSIPPPWRVDGSAGLPMRAWIGVGYLLGWQGLLWPQAWHSEFPICFARLGLGFHFISGSVLIWQTSLKSSECMTLSTLTIGSCKALFCFSLFFLCKNNPVLSPHRCSWWCS